MSNDSYLTELRKYAEEQSVPILRSDCAQILHNLVHKEHPMRLLEVGTAIGYSTLLIASIMPDTAELITLEIDPGRAEVAQRYIQQAGLSDRVTVIVGDASTSITKVIGEFDFVFLDGPKGQYLTYLHLLLDKLADGAVVVADNVLFRGMVTSETVPRRFRTLVRRLREYLHFISHDKRFSTTLLTDGDGVAISYYHRS